MPHPINDNSSDLAASDRRTLAALFEHPIANNLTWAAIVRLFGHLGSVEEKSNDEFAFQVGAEHLKMRKPHTKDLTAPDVLDFRHFATRLGHSPNREPQQSRAGEPATPSFLVVIDHHEARVYLIEAGSDTAKHVIRPYDPHHFLHHLSHKDQSRERGQWAHEDATFYERIAKTVATGGKIVLVGHGEGKSSAVHHLAEYLATHHHETYQRVVREAVADLSHITEPQLLEIGLRALSA